MNVRQPSKEKQREIAAILKALHDVVASEEVPQHLDALVKSLGTERSV